ncbi:peptide/nickel transport system substrate-binding protein [Hamadaea flava]|uniref:ABC transporter substrate-binding protein n=1 Tax=Hamadaea flava TaxID=1742688 RepID=A0ABV8LYX9_9ACTN|nr:ABC transporter substrate-binding protein [Hamadaea flava]MCP2328940.1 peptide/nickel transport system substrate-binding protein [Hamadaea flava]
MRRTTITAALAVVAALALTACNANSGSGTNTASTGTQQGGDLAILTSSSSVTLDPAKSQNLAITTLGLIFRRLTTWDIKPGQEGKVVGDLAQDAGTPSDGGKTWTFKLKPNLKYADGTAITAADVKYGVERSFAPELSGGLGYHKTLLVGGAEYKGPYTGKELDSIEVPDAQTIVFKLTKPFGDWPWIVSMPAFAPVPKAKDDVANYGKNPVASGPYQVDSYQQGTALKLKRNTYWEASSDPVRTGGPDTITFQLGQEATVAAQRLIADSGADKNAFGASFVPPAQLAQIQANAAAKQRLVTSDPGALAYLAINTTRGPLKDPKVRQALNYAVDKKAYLVAAGGTLGGDYASTLITPGIAGRVEYNLYPTADPSGDVDKAKALLAEAGQSNLKLTFVVQNDSDDLARAQAIQQGLARIGVELTIKPLDSDSWFDAVTNDKGDYDLTLSSWQPDYPSANANIQPLFASSEIGGGGFNLSRYSNAEVDALIEQARAEVDPAKAQALWQQADKRILTDAPIVPLIYTKNSFLHGSAVQNFQVAAFPAYPNYLKVSLSK